MAEHRSDCNEFGRSQVGSNPRDEPRGSGGRRAPNWVIWGVGGPWSNMGQQSKHGSKNTFVNLNERVVSIQDTLAPASPPDRATPRASVAVLHVGLGEDAVHEVVAEPSRSPTPCTPPPQRPERSPGTKAAQKGAVRGLRLGMTPPGHLAPPHRARVRLGCAPPPASAQGPAVLPRASPAVLSAKDGGSLSRTCRGGTHCEGE